jgi:YihY family inner membrane protein
MELLMLIGLGALMLISVGLTTAFKIISNADLTVLGQQFADGGLLWQFAVIAASVFVLFLAFLFLYKLVPNTHVQWRHAAIGALVAAILFEIFKNLFAWFVADFARYNIIYGSVSIVITLMIWAYISAVILLFCAKLTSTYPKMKSTLATEALAEESAAEKLPNLMPSPSMIFANMSSLTSGGVGALRRLMLGKG